MTHLFTGRLVRILLIEDNPDDAALLQRELKKDENGWRLYIEVINNIKDIIHCLTNKSWDIVIADYNLQGFDATDVINILEELGLDIPLILVSGFIDDNTADELIRSGVSDYVSKNRMVRLHPILKRELALRDAYGETLSAWVAALDIRDQETAGHSQRVTEYTVNLARAMGRSEAEITHIRRGALLHDIGKMGIPDAILLKTESLTESEMRIMMSHTEIGYNFIKGIKYLRYSVSIPHYHHEKWDGTGYPIGLEGNDIPIHARMFSVVDVWDALTSDRPYRKAWSFEKTKEYMLSQSEKAFDPIVVRIFFEQFSSIVTDTV